MSSWWSGTKERSRIRSQSKMLSAHTRANASIKRVGRPGTQLYTLDLQGPAGTDHLPPVVLLHGFGMGLAFWARQFDEISKHRRVIAFDLPGSGCSDRPSFSGNTPKKAEDHFLVAISEWQKAMGIQRMILVGHAFGAYLAATYALRFPKSVSQLLMSSPVGLEKYNRFEDHGDAHMLMSALWSVHITPQLIVRMLGRWMGMSVVKSFAASRFFGESKNAIAQISDYMYHLWVMQSDAESAYRVLIGMGGYGKKPLCDRLHKLRSPATFIFGEHDWRPHRGLAKVVLIKDAGHHSYLDNHTHFNALVCRALTHGPDGRAAAKKQPDVYSPTADVVETKPSRQRARRPLLHLSKGGDAEDSEEGDGLNFVVF